MEGNRLRDSIKLRPEGRIDIEIDLTQGFTVCVEILR
nr:MAG TPA: hypothetical protein [Caudoviricetes sp.]